VEFTVYAEDITELLIKLETQSQLHADDTQLYASCRTEDVDAVRTRLSNCTANIAVWCDVHLVSCSWMRTRLNRSGLDPVRTSPRWKVVIAQYVTNVVSSYFYKSLSSTSNPLASWDRSGRHNLYWHSYHHVSIIVTHWLSADRPPTGIARAIAVCPKSSCVVNSRPQPVRSRDTGSASAALVVNTLAHPVQVVFYHVIHSCTKIPRLHDVVRS